MGKIILASSSPRRADILKKLKLDFEIIPSDYVEKHDQAVFSYSYAEKLAYNKAYAVAQKLHKEKKYETVLGADTIVVIDNKILGKPQNREEAINMLKMLSGRTHFVVTAIALINSSDYTYKLQSDTTYVTFEDLSNNQIIKYVDEFNPLDKAGSYGIQELPDGFVKKLKGNLDNVIGLPTKLLKEMISE